MGINNYVQQLGCGSRRASRVRSYCSQGRVLWCGVHDHGSSSVPPSPPWHSFPQMLPLQGGDLLALKAGGPQMAGFVFTNALEKPSAMN